MLKIIKRVKSQADKDLYALIKNDIFGCSDEDFDSIAICKKYFKQIEKFSDAKGYMITYLNKTAETLNTYFHEKETEHIKVNSKDVIIFVKKLMRLNGTIEEKHLKFFEGIELHCKTYLVRDGKTLRTNYVYYIKSVNPKDRTLILTDPAAEYELENQDKKEVKADFKINLEDLNHFSMKYANTCHSAQGETKDVVTLFDIGFHRITKNWLWTGITRVTQLSEVFFYVAKSKENETANVKKIINAKIQGHKTEDLKKGRVFDEKDYISNADVSRLYEEQLGKCFFTSCQQELNMDYQDNREMQFSINRLDNKRAHVKGNC
eukprot:Pompholyxophrys_punicea_v1_NODE_104_length_3475_cov_32.445776.p2 type:complete len:320 gc:universal NODE_104_length_3475_cov_32.445776:1363-2322(+)